MQVKHITIIEATSPKGGKVPFIKILGKFLEEAGFQADKSVRLEIAPNRIVITPAPEVDKIKEQKTEELHQLFGEIRRLNGEVFELDGHKIESKESHKRTQPVGWID